MLLVEDDTLIQNVIPRMLDSLDAELSFDVAISSDEGIAKIATFKPHLICLDIQLGMDRSAGFRIVKHLVEMRLDGISLVVYTACPRTVGYDLLEHLWRRHRGTSLLWCDKAGEAAALRSAIDSVLQEPAK